MPLRSDQYRNDPRVIQAKQLLLEATRAHTEKLTTPQAADPSLTASYAEIIKAYSQARGNNLFYPYLGSGFGNGPLVELQDGSVKYDMISGIGVHFFGHSHPGLTAAAFDASLSDTIMQGNLQQNAECLKLADLLVKASGLPHCFFSTSGVMSNENAVKIAFQKNAPASRILAFERCFAGRSLTFSQVTDKPSFREGLPLNVPVDYLPFYDPKNPEESIEKTARQLETLIERYPKAHAVMIFELVQGEGGFYVGSRPFFKRLMEICKKNGIAVFSDEVQTFGRTPELFAFKYFQLEEYVDICAIGKLSQVCATLFSDAYSPKVGLLSQTFTGSTASIMASQYIINHLLQGGYYGPKGRMMAIYQRFESHLKGIEKEHPGLVHGPYGIGAMIAFTLLDGKHDTTNRFLQGLFKAGVIAFNAGSHPTRVRLLPPAGIITDEAIDRVMEIIKSTLVKFQKENK